MGSDDLKFVEKSWRNNFRTLQIGASRAKGIAARENGAKLFLVPPGQKEEVGDIGIEVKEVRTIEEAVKYAI
jgi:predicted S18 family serine protease